MRKSLINKHFVIIANAALGKGLSGSDRIFIEISKRLSSTFDISVCVWEEGFQMCQRQNLTGVRYEKWFLYNLKNLPFLFCYFLRIFSGIYYAIKFSNKGYKQEDCFFYSASDFWQDFIPFIILKIRFPKSKFISSFYLEAPNPLIGFRREYENKIQFPKIKDFLYYFAQFLPKQLIPKISDYIFVTSEPDKSYFISRGFDAEKVLVIMGGVDFSKYNSLKTKIEKKYDAVFYGRFHPQKGVLELIDIWSILIKKLPDAKLVMIGDGPLTDIVREKIHSLKLEKNILLKGHLDDSIEKYELFAQSKVVVHPAVYDSGGMASAEVMFLGIPGVSFDLEALKTYYPKGMLKSKCFDLKGFSDNIFKLLTEKDFYQKTSTQAKECVLENFDWDKKCEFIIKTIL